MPAQGNVTATLAVLRMKNNSSMKKHLAFTLLMSLMGLLINPVAAQQNAANLPSNNKTNQPALADSLSTADSATDVETIEAAMVNAVNLGKRNSNISSIQVISIQRKDPIAVQNLGRDIPFLTQSLTNVIST